MRLNTLLTNNKGNISAKMSDWGFSCALVSENFVYSLYFLIQEPEARICYEMHVIQR